ncbi:helix-turn-helix domain-containing protein [Pedobacter sp. HMF7647]|uniref:Helix-turn-helix domain-containing protein n=1 Tax=Hufsiella arboris TaxID=2695275 RepID=A0A7K1YEI2_9SPHI|nr:pentapeptide repeat-containing protein [Hufsiella arboris]MXV53006.1 helix-turn-helix domain-containing protein [Hufsiella arboris]
MDTKKIGSKIAKARKEINISQARLGQLIFVSPQAVGKWERGESIPDIITFNRLAQILGVDLNYFSDTFKSAVNEAATESLVTQPAELLPEQLENKVGWDMSRGNWVDADFSELKNLHEKFSSSSMQNCKFIASDLSKLLLKNNNIDSCNFSGSDLSSSRIRNSNLVNNLFNDCSLKEAELSDSHIKGCDFSGADFSGVTFKSSDFVKNIMINTVWNRASFNSTHFADLVFDGTIENCHFENCGFSRVTFQNATLINIFFKNNHRLKQVQFIDCKADNLTYAFLKNGKADLTGITLLAT